MTYPAVYEVKISSTITHECITNYNPVNILYMILNYDYFLSTFGTIGNILMLILVNLLLESFSMQDFYL